VSTLQYTVILQPFAVESHGFHQNAQKRSLPTSQLASCLIYAWALQAHPVCNCQLFGCILLLNQIYLTTVYRSTIPLRLIWSICSGH